mmetsp:Transcript_82480/g.156966  ORF Transcript_82480/g.156966 Transcript_82480/m.156966 type:complete len:397 (-) Transcript_82480:54-1244(-)
MGRHGGINILHQKSWHVWRMDNRLRVERDEQQHAAEEAEKRRASEQAVFDQKLKHLRRRAAGEPEAPEAVLDEHTSTASLASSSSSAGVREEKSDKSKVNEYKGVFGVTLSNLKQAEAHLDFTLGRKGKGKGKGKSKEASDKGRSSGGLGSGPHINFFEDAEREQQHHMAEHEKQLRYTQANNEIVGKSKKALFSEFDEISSTVPWYLKPRQAEESPGAEDDIEASKGRRQDAIDGREALALRNASRSRSRTPPKRKRWTTSHGQVVLQVKPEKQSVQVKAALKDEKEELRPIDDVKDFGVAQPVAHEIGSSDSDAHYPADLALSSIGVVLCKKEGGREKKRKKEKKSKEDKKSKKERKVQKQDLKKLELERLRQQRMERERAERARVVRMLPGVC